MSMVPYIINGTGRVQPKPPLLLRLAIGNCFARCIASGSYLATLQDFREELERLHWDQQSIAKVEAGVLDALYGREKCTDARASNCRDASDKLSLFDVPKRLQAE